MQTTQLPFFLNSGQGKNRSPTGHAFDVELSPPVTVPKNAQNTRLFVQEASAVYSFPNVTSTTNRIDLYFRGALFTLRVAPGLYGTVDELQAGIAAAAIAAKVTKTRNDLDAVASTEDFAANWLQITPDSVESRVRLEIMDQDVQVHMSSTEDMFVNVLGFATSQGPLHAPAAEFYATVATPTDEGGWNTLGQAHILMEWRLSGQSDFQSPIPAGQYARAYIPAAGHRYSTEALRNTLNEKFSAFSAGAAPTIEQLFVTKASDGTISTNVVLSTSNANIAAVRFPATSTIAGVADNDADLQTAGASLLPTGAITPLVAATSATTAWTEITEARRASIVALNPATVDRVHSLQIAVPGLATGVHVNGEGGSSTLCRFPVNTEPGGVVQFEPINPIKNTYDMSGTRLTRFRVELQDQHGDPVDTRSEEFNCTIVIEYEVPSAGASAEH